MSKVLLIVHQETSNPGLVGQLLKAKGYELDVCCPAQGDRLPVSMDDHAAVVVFGGPMSANDDPVLPFIRTELNWIPIALSCGKPFLGICLGAQMLARVLGATVAPHPEEMREIGYFPIQPTAAATECFSQPMYVYHWHREGFEVPPGAVLLAQGHTFNNQAFRYGETAYGLQFHPEITGEMIGQWTAQAADQLSLPGAQSCEEQFQRHQRYGPLMQTWLGGFLDRWLRSNPQSEPPRVTHSAAAICNMPIQKWTGIRGVSQRA